MSPEERSSLRAIFSALAGAATTFAVATASALPAPAGIVARVLAAALGSVSLMLREGASIEEAIGAIKRVRHIDTSADDAAVDAKVDAKPLGKRFQEMRPVMHAVDAEPPAGLWGEPGEDD